MIMIMIMIKVGCY